MKDNPDEYGPDLWVEGDKGNFWVEVGVKHPWKSTNFPFDTIQVEERKGKFLQYDPIFFMILSDDLKRAVVIPKKAFYGIKPKMVKNKMIREGELFYQIPIKLCKIIDLKE